MGYNDDMNDDWKDKLTPEQYHVLRQKGTERPFSGELLNNQADGMYVCAACGTELFSSETKFESGSGWPSFWQAVDDHKLTLKPDDSYGMHRTEVQCANCGGHLGHVFDDNAQPSGKYYCINSVSLDFKEKE